MIQCCLHAVEFGVSVEPSEFPSIDPSQRSPFAVLILGGARAQLRLCLAPKAAALHANAPWRCPIGYDDNVQQVALAGDRLYWTTMRDHPNGQVLTAPIYKSGKLGATEVLLAEDPTAVVTGLAAAKDALYLKRMQGGPEEILRRHIQAASRPSCSCRTPGRSINLWRTRMRRGWCSRCRTRRGPERLTAPARPTALWRI